MDCAVVCFSGSNVNYIACNIRKGEFVSEWLSVYCKPMLTSVAEISLSKVYLEEFDTKHLWIRNQMARVKKRLFSLRVAFSNVDFCWANNV